MRYAAACALVAALVIAIATLASTGEARESEPAGEKFAQEVPEGLMRQKLEHAQKLLEALSIGDFDRMISNSKELHRISLEARWSQPHSPAYAAYGDDFRAALDRIVIAAEKQNIDGASLNYVQVVLTCIQCHKVVREGEELAHQAGSDDFGLLDRALALAAE
jgi:hypothetical protein